MIRRAVFATLFCVLAWPVLVASGQQPTPPKPALDRVCTPTNDGGEVCVRTRTSCSAAAPDPLRAGAVVVVVETNNSAQPVDASVTIGQLEPRQVTLTEERRDLGELVGFVQATGRPDAHHPVKVVVSGPGIPDSSLQLPELVATTWCGPDPTLIACSVGATTVNLTIDNTAGAVAVDVAQTDRRGRELLTSIGVVDAGETATVAFDPVNPLGFWIKLTAVDATDTRQILHDQSTCNFETVDCASTTPSIALSDCTAMRDVLVALGADRGLLRYDLCLAVRCENGHVTEISFIDRCSDCADLAERTLSPSIGQLAHLERLTLVYGPQDSARTIGGPIPAEVGQLPNLVSLVLQGHFEGGIPPEIGQLRTLIELNLRGNELTGAIPESITALPSLRSIALSDNNLEGPLPATLGDIPSLRLVDLSGNQFTGPVPANLIRDGIEELILSSNRLDSLPEAAGPVAAVDAPQSFMVANNEFSGALPAWLTTIDVDKLDLSDNNFSGPLPANLSDLSPQLLDLSDNQLTGAIPESIVDIAWTRPRYQDKPRLDLSDNQLTGAIPSEIAASGLIELLLANNGISGTIPSSLAGSVLSTLDLAGNELDGEIPPDLGPMPHVDLSNNNLTGAMPASLFAQRYYPHTLRLGGNQLSGRVPEDIAKFNSSITVDILPNGCLTASAEVIAVLPSVGIDPTRLCEASGVQQFCRDRPVTVDLALGEAPTAGDDVILGTPGPDEIAAGDGDDLVCGGGGDDAIWGQGGNDEIHGDDGDDHIRGGAGEDLLFGHDGRDNINGGTGNDEVWGQGDNDYWLRGGSGDDLVHGGAGNDIINGNGGTDQVFGGDGNDSVSGGPRGDTISGGAGNDIIYGNGGADTIAGNGGNDFVWGGPQSDTIDGGDGDDDCNGGANNAVVPDETIRCETESNIP